MKNVTRRQLKEMIMNEVTPWGKGGFTFVEMQEDINGALRALEEAADKIDYLMETSMDYGDPEFEFLEGREMIMQLEKMKIEIKNYAHSVDATAEVDAELVGTIESP